LRSGTRQPRPAPVPVPARVPAVIVEAGAIAEADAPLDMEADLITGAAREVEEDCATPLCM
jgi:hypothetical protein